MPPVRKIKVPLADFFWLPFFSEGIQATLREIRKTVTERNALLSYCECVSFNWAQDIQQSLIKNSYRPPQTWQALFGTDEKFEVLGTNRGDLNKPPHGTPAGFAYHYDDCPVLVAKLLMQIAGFDHHKSKSLADRLLLWQNYDPGAEARFSIWRKKEQMRRRTKMLRQPFVPKRMLNQIKKLHPDDWADVVANIERGTAARRAKLAAEKEPTISKEELEAAKRHHAEWHEIEKVLNTPFEPIDEKELRPTIGAFGIKLPPKERQTSEQMLAIKKGDLSKAAHDVIRAREKILKDWPSIPDFVPPELLSSKIDFKKRR